LIVHGIVELSNISCVSTSAAVQCAMADPDVLCGGAVDGARHTSSVTAAGTAKAWHHEPGVWHNVDRACWMQYPEASWGKCCWPGAEALDIGVLHGGEPAITMPEGCPDAGIGCCKIHSRLSRRWEPFEGYWQVQFSNGKRAQWLLSSEGKVQMSPTAMQPWHRSIGVVELPTSVDWQIWKCGKSALWKPGSDGGSLLGDHGGHCHLAVPHVLDKRNSINVKLKYLILYSVILIWIGVGCN
jgi:hypothetical protein